MSNQEIAPTYKWDVRIDDSLKRNVKKMALDENREIRQIVSQAVKEFLEKQKTKENDQ
jgi:predicted transcriptional regulator